MHRINAPVVWHLPLGLAMLFTGCTPSDKAASTNGADQSAASSTTARADAASSSKLAASDEVAAGKNSANTKPAAERDHAPSTAKRAAAKSPAELATPASLEEVARVIDFRKFPMLPAGKVFHQLLAKVGYELRDSDPAQASRFYRTKLDESGWKLEPEQVQQEHNFRSFSATKQGFLVSVSVVKSPASGKLEVFAANQGNVDARTLPRFSGAKLTTAYFHSASYLANGKLEDVVDFTRTELKKRGWREVGVYGGKDPLRVPGSKDRVGFLQRGSQINATFEVKQDQTDVRCSVHILQDELPIMPEARGYIEFMEDPTHLFYGVPTTPDQVLAYYRRELPKLGWTVRAGTDGLQDGKAKVMLDAPEKKPLRLELLEDKPGHTVVYINRMSQE